MCQSSVHLITQLHNVCGLADVCVYPCGLRSVAQTPLFSHFRIPLTKICKCLDVLTQLSLNSTL